MEIYHPTKETVFESLSDLYPSIDFLSFIKSIPDAEIFIYGGFLRDLAFGKKPKEADLIIVSDRPMEEFEADTEKTLAQRHFTMLGKVSHEDSANYHYLPPGVTSLVSGIDINLHQTLDLNHPETDFTINSLYMNLAAGILSDPYGALKDIRAGILRSAQDSRIAFRDHPLYIFRAIKCMCQFDLVFDPLTKQEIAANVAHAHDTMAYVADHRQTLLGEWMLDNIFRGLRYNSKQYFSLHQELGTLDIFLSFVATRLGYKLVAAKTLENPFVGMEEKSYERNLSVFLSFLIDQLSIRGHEKVFADMLELWGFTLANKYHGVGVDPAKMSYISKLS